MNEADAKKVDSSWKERAEKEKRKTEAEQASPDGKNKEGELNFAAFAAGLYYEGLMALGKTENPLDKTPTKNLAHARQIIDILMMLKEKTAGNLNAQEANALDQMIYALQREFVEAS